MSKLNERYTLIDANTGLICGPYESLEIAEAHAEDFEAWEILLDDDKLVAWKDRPVLAREPELLAA